MFGSLGLPELVLIFVVALLLFGPRKLPEIGRSVGKALGEFRRASNDLRRTVEEEIAVEDLRHADAAVRQAATAEELPADATAQLPAQTPHATPPEGERP
ncbi:MAG: twin-arginine translocase subunit TatB [Thermoanaerobaculaceae bacterium]|nr:twin-arginine translocase subunit TatB [Thermoanaerobaculaceae bacterium]